MTIAITCNLPNRFDGFLRSCMHEIAPGTYVSPAMSKGVRERLWEVMIEWNDLIPSDGGIVLFWKNNEAPSGLSLRLLGWPQKELTAYEGIWLTHRKLTKAEDLDELKKLIHKEEPKRGEHDLIAGEV